MLLAVSLMTILIAAITTTTGFFVHISSKGRIQMEQAFTVECIIEDLMLDLKATSRSISPPQDSEVGESSSALASGGDVGAERMLQWESARESRYVNFVGNSGAIMITRDGVNPRFTGQSTVALKEDPHNSQHHILWMSPSVHQTTLAAELSGPLCINRTFARPNSSSGLLRAYIHQNILFSSMTTNEVIATQFRYWDGKTWEDSWNSFTKKNQLPTAIEIRIRLKTAPEKWQRFICRLEQPFYSKLPKSMYSADRVQP